VQVCLILACLGVFVKWISVASASHRDSFKALPGIISQLKPDLENGEGGDATGQINSKRSDPCWALPGLAGAPGCSSNVSLCDRGRH